MSEGVARSGSSPGSGAASAAPQRYFGSSAVPGGVRGRGGGIVAVKEMMLGGVGIESVMGFVMAWTLVYNYVGT